MSFKAFGFDVVVVPMAFLEFAVAVFLANDLRLVFLGRPLDWAEGMAFSALMTSIVAISVTLHEFGHAAVARAAGVRVEKIVLAAWLSHVLLRAERDVSPWRLLAISIAGVAANAGFACILAAALVFAELPEGFVREAVVWGLTWEFLSVLLTFLIVNQDREMALSSLRRLCRQRTHGS